MWPLIVIVLAASLAGLHLWWSRRNAVLQTEVTRLTDEASAAAEQRQRTQAQAQAQQAALFDSMSEGVLVLDANGRVELANQALQHLTGVAADILGRTILEAFRLHELSDLVKRAGVERQVAGIEIDWPGPDARRLQVSAAAILDTDKRQHGFILVFHDLTRLKQLENTRQEFVANVSHELRTPLSLIKGYVETLIDGAKDDPVVTARFLQTILKHADRLTYLIEDLLTLSQLESGRAVLNFQRIELHPLTARVLDDLQSRAGNTEINLKNEVPPGLEAHADADRLQQVLFNLVDNGIKYGRGGGVVEVGARQVDAEFTEMWVKDNGPGIPIEAVERIFERFYRVDRARSREQGGTGLGLSIVKHIVQSHGGRVWVRSEVGHGSTFFFTLANSRD